MRKYYHECPLCKSQLKVIEIIGNQNDKIVTCTNGDCEMSEKHFNGWAEELDVKPDEIEELKTIGVSPV